MIGGAVPRSFAVVVLVCLKGDRGFADARWLTLLQQLRARFVIHVSGLYSVCTAWGISTVLLDQSE
jgi:hypothetical protein